MIVMTVSGVLFFSELGQFLVWQLIGVKVPGIEIKVSPDSAMTSGQGLGLIAQDKALDIEFDFAGLAVETIR
ncbi:hypothetical protein [Photobacterium minamisatsumaniensis]|uniref:hypothetical protein n=1 Tax=Photobacterium minamisatsumaniensis TaxID=2910233 RepID=UPI003D0A6829